VELQDNKDNNVMSIRAEPGKEYPIRLLHLMNGMLVIGFVISIVQSTILMLRPYIVDIDYDAEDKNIVAYALDPYLDQLVHYEANSLDPVPFILDNVVSVNIPARHLMENYNNIISMASIVAIDEDKLKIRRSEFLNDKTVH